MDMDNSLLGPDLARRKRKRPLSEEGVPIDAVPALPENELDSRDIIGAQLVALFVLTMNNN
jgi:hypothetical protein